MKKFIYIFIFVASVFMISGCESDLFSSLESDLLPKTEGKNPIAVIHNLYFKDSKVTFDVNIIDDNKVINLDTLEAVLYKNGIIEDKISMKDDITGLTFEGLSPTDNYYIKIEGLCGNGDNKNYIITLNSSMSSFSLLESFSLKENMLIETVYNEKKSVLGVEVNSKFDNIDKIVEINTKCNKYHNKVFYTLEGENYYTYYYGENYDKDTLYKSPISFEKIYGEKGNGYNEYGDIITSIVNSSNPIITESNYGEDSKKGYSLEYLINLSSLANVKKYFDDILGNANVIMKDNISDSKIKIELVFEQETGIFRTAKFDFTDLIDMFSINSLNSIKIENLKYTLSLDDINNTVISDANFENARFKMDHRLISINDSVDLTINDHMTIEDSLDYKGDYKIYKFNESYGYTNITFNTDNGSIRALYVDDINQHVQQPIIKTLSDSQYNKFYYIVVYLVDDNIGDFTLNIEYYNEYNDDHPDYISENVKEIPLNEYYEAHSYNNYEDDVFKFKIEDSGLYSIRFKYNYGTSYITGDMKFTLYNANGEKLDFNEDIGESMYFFESGQYYIQVDTYCEGKYEFIIDHIIDDNPDPILMQLNEGLNEFKTTFDYIGDEESFVFTIDKSTLIELELSYSYFKIYNENGEEITDRMGSKMSKLSYYFSPGTYTVKIMGKYFEKEITLYVNKNSSYIDYSNEIVEGESNYGELNLGITNIEFDLTYDKDIYYIDIVDEDWYSIFYEIPYSDYFYITNSGEYVRLQSGKPMFLSSGRHFFSFEGRNPEIVEINLMLNPDDNTEENMGIANIGSNTYTTITYQEDIDYFKLNVNETSTYSIYINRWLTIKLEDTNGNIIGLDFNNVPGVMGKKAFFTVSEGEYIIEVNYDYFKQSKFEELFFKIEELNLNDEAPNSLYLPLIEYRTIEIGIGNEISGKIDYQGDRDVYLINVLEDGEYRFFLSGYNVSVYCNNLNGDIMSCPTSYFSHINKGMYYIIVAKINGTSDYNLGFYKNITKDPN
ncbi:hypothetical protein KHQ81_08185 [Mycoplasmatota bacterium]|nr:hypothetical protein KHQ81_08185 [Mycoplasmatota bacterium]